MASSRSILFVMGLAVASGLDGCGDDDGGGDGGGGTSAAVSTTGVGMANPASVFCESQGGTVSIVTDYGGGQRGTCELPDGTVVDEWEYYREYHTEGDGPTLANPAAVFCEEQGGTVSGDEPMCTLPDGTEVDAWDYYREQAAEDG